MATPVADKNNAIHVDNIDFFYFESSNGVKRADFKLSPGDRVLLIGHNGCGKSTLLSLVGGRHKVREGAISVLGRDAFEDTTLNHRVGLFGPPWPPEAYFGNTVDVVCSPSPFPIRKHEYAKALHLPLKKNVDKMSSGERRRVQILHGLLHESEVLLMDECSTDIDVAERKTVLDIVKAECMSTEATVPNPANGGTDRVVEDMIVPSTYRIPPARRQQAACCVYATHILDGVEGWATHVALMVDREVVDFRRVEEVEALGISMEEYAHQFVSKNRGRKPLYSEYVADAKNPMVISEEAVLKIQGMNHSHIFANMNLEVKRGSRTLLLGCNGTGKSTLLDIIGGKRVFVSKPQNGKLMVDGRVLYDDMSLNYFITYCGDWWTKVPGGEMHVCQMVPQPMTKRAYDISQLLHVDMDWDVRHISAGECKRVQLLLHLQVERPMVVLDEATADLDVDQRHELLRFLYEESVLKGVTIIYTTHIFEGLLGWASHVAVLDSTTKGVYSNRTLSDEESASPALFKELAAELCFLKAREVF